VKALLRHRLVTIAGMKERLSELESSPAEIVGARLRTLEIALAAT
jgi:hypothetical protein